MKKIAEIVFLGTIFSFLLSVLIAGALGTTVPQAFPFSLLVTAWAMLIFKELDL